MRLSPRMKPYRRNLYESPRKLMGEKESSGARSDPLERITISRIPAVASLAQAINNCRRGRAISQHYEIIMAVVRESPSRERQRSL